MKIFKTLSLQAVSFLDQLRLTESSWRLFLLFFQKIVDTFKNTASENADEMNSPELIKLMQVRVGEFGRLGAMLVKMNEQLQVLELKPTEDTEPLPVMSRDSPKPKLFSWSTE